MTTLTTFLDKLKQLFSGSAIVITASADGKYNVKLRQSNQLLNTIGIARINQVKQLTITGKINTTDLTVIKKMKQMEYLDIQHTQIVSNHKTIHPGNKRIGKHLFQGNLTLKSILLPDTVTEIADSAFAGCLNLSAIHLPKNLMQIGSQSFTQTGITEISIPSSVIHIEENAFSQCKQLQTVHFEDGKQSMKWTGLGFSGCPVSELYIGRNISEDDYCEFDDPSTLQRVTIGPNVSRLNIYLGENLKELTFLCPTPPSGNIVLPRHCTIKVPASYYENYWIHPIWGEKDIQPMEQ